MTKSTFEGQRFLLAHDASGMEWVARYEVSEMADLFTADQLADLEGEGRCIAADKRGNMVLWVDMIIAARASVQEVMA